MFWSMSFFVCVTLYRRRKKKQSEVLKAAADTHESITSLRRVLQPSVLLLTPPQIPEPMQGPQPPVNPLLLSSHLVRSVGLVEVRQ